MIKLFRKIRYDLIEKKNTIKYLKYAFGEIFLVVIGILIALSINSWNEERKRSSQENIILLDLKSDFQESKERLLITMNMQNLVIKRSSALIQIYEGKIPMPINDSIKLYLAYGAYSWYRPELITGAYDALINTGNSELIKNRNLLKELADYYSIVNSGFEDHDNVMDLLNNLETIAESTILPLSMAKGRLKIGLDTIPNPNEDLAIKFIFEQNAFFGHLYEKTSLEHLRYTIQQELLMRIEKILSVINKELST